MRSRHPDEPVEIRRDTRRKPLYIYADTETYLETHGVALWDHKEEEGFSTIVSENCDVIPWLLAAKMPKIYIKDNKKEVNEEVLVDFWSAEFPHPRFFEALRDYYELGFWPIVMFHNTSYDLTACIETCFRELDPNVHVYFYAKDGNKNFLNGRMESPKYKFKADFGDTLLYKRISLGTIGEMMGVPKGEIPYHMSDLFVQNGNVHYQDWWTGKHGHVTLKEAVEYALRDVELLWLYHLQLQRETAIITEVVNGGHDEKISTTTQGAHARSLLNMYLHRSVSAGFKNIFKFPVTKEEGLLQNRTLSGGFTTLNSKFSNYVCKKGEKIASFDCNSMYPAIMRNGIPCGELLDVPHPHEDSVEWVLVSCYNVEWKGLMAACANRPIPTHQQSLKDKGEIRFYLERSYLEWIKERSTGEFIEHYSKFQRITQSVGNFVSKLYNLRTEKKEEIKQIEQQMEEGIKVAEGTLERLKAEEQGIKTTMNSLYGKLAEKPYLTRTFYHRGKFRSTPDLDSQYHCVLSGAYIAMRGRWMVYQKIEKVLEAGFKLVYADTDSVKFAYPTDERHMLQEIFGANAGDLGQWKDEGTWDEFHSPQKMKKYTLLSVDEPWKSVVKLSGVRDDIYITALKKGLVDDPEQTLDDLRYIFNPKHNVTFKKAKNISTRSHQFDQSVILPIDVKSNPDIKKITGECRIEKGKYILERYEPGKYR